MLNKVLNIINWCITSILIVPGIRCLKFYLILLPITYFVEFSFKLKSDKYIYISSSRIKNVSSNVLN